MAVKFLDNIGLGYFWSKIKAWCNATFAAITHNQASNTINVMTGYTKPSSGSALATTDSLNQALGKLEAKVDTALDDSNYVHKTGDELIQGVKEFKNSYDDTPNSSNPDCSHSIIIRTTRFRKGTDVTTLPGDDYCNVIFQDNSGSLIGHDGRLASVEYGAYTNGTYVTRLGTYKNDLSVPNTIADLGVGYDSDGIAYSFAPATSVSRTAVTDIVTRGYLNSRVADYLPLIGGTLTGKLIIDKSNNTPSDSGILLSGASQNFAINISNTSITKGTAPSATKYQAINFYGKDTDSYTKRLGYLEYVLDTSNVSSLCLRAYNTTTNTNTEVCTISANVDGSGNPYTYAPTPEFTKDNTEIATAYWVRRYNRITCRYGDVITKPYRLIATCGARMTSSFMDWGITLLVDRPYGYGPSGSGICMITVRTSNVTNNEAPAFQLHWIARSGNIGNCIRVGYISTPGNSVCDIYFHNAIGWCGAFVTVLSQSGNRYNNPNAYYSVGEGFQTFCGTTDDDSQKYVTLNDGAQALWGEDYTGTIESAPYISDKGGDIQGNINFICPNAVRGVVPSARSEYDIFHYDKNNAKLGCLAFYYETNKASRVGLFAYDTTITANNVSIGQLSIGCDSSGNIFTQAPTPVATDNSTQIATTAWVRTYTRGNLLYLQGIDIAKGSNPSNSKYWAVYACDKNGTSYQANTFGIVEVSLNSAGDTASYVRALSNNTSNVNSCSIGAAYKTSSSYGYVFCTGSLEPASGKTCGTSSAKWSAVWATNGTIQTSDERVKTNIDAIPEYVLDAWENIQWKQFKMKDSVKEKGDKARLHTGIVAQQIQKEFEDKNIDVTKYGFFCWDKWDDSDAMLDSNGNVIVEAIKADEQYSVRYDEALCIEAAYQRRKNKILENRISELETQVQNMLQILESLKGA